MAENQYTQVIILIICLTFSDLASCSTQPRNGQQGKSCSTNFRGMFVFGTSVVDNGNNNYLNRSLSKANYRPYGIDFPFGPTGRFSNGKTVADFISLLLHLPLIPPFASPNTKGNFIIHGVNYGSGGSGILDDTGSVSGEVITMNQQIKNFEEVTFPEVKALLGDHATQKLGQYLFLVATGNNDLEFNYFLQPSSSRPSLPVFVNNLTSAFRNQLQRLYNVGARKFALLTVYPIGCTPVVKEQSGSSNCVQLVNNAAKYYNVQLKFLVDDLNQRLPGSDFILVNTYKIIRDIIETPIPRGFSNATGACCELRSINGARILCKEDGEVCSNRNSYVYFDGQHNTQAVNDIIATKAFSSNYKTEAYPFNLQTLANKVSTYY